jgi:di/tricarboxylate transporter
MSTDVLIVFAILFAAVVMFSTGKIRNDVAAIIIMLSLAWTNVIPLDLAFSGFSSNAVISNLHFGIQEVKSIALGVKLPSMMAKRWLFLVKRSKLRNFLTLLI